MVKPAEEHILDGGASKKPINLGARSEKPFPKRPPIKLTPLQKQIWEDLSEQWSHVLTHADVSRFEKHVILESIWEDSYISGDVDTLLKLVDKLNKGYSDFGATPVARTKLPGVKVSYSSARNKGLKEIMDSTQSLLTH